MRPGLHNLRVLAGMSFSAACAASFWVGWLAWCAAALGALCAEYLLRVSDPPAGYFVEALLAMLAWLLTLAAADQHALHTYLRTWDALMHAGEAKLLLSETRLEAVRAELGRLPFLGWTAPPRARDMGAQLWGATLWYQAMHTPQGTSAWRRYGEWLIDCLAGFLPLPAACAAALVWPSQTGLALAALLSAIGLATLGYSAIRFAARRQAILDYFQAWLGDRRSSNQTRSGATPHDEL